MGGIVPCRLSGWRVASGLALAVVGHGAPSAAEPPPADAGRERSGAAREAAEHATTKALKVVETLHATTALSRLSVRCEGAAAGDAEEGDAPQSDRMRCAFFTLSLRRRPPERLATLENYAEILRSLRAQCRAASTRTESARKACAACRDELSDECLYLQSMLELRKGCKARVSRAPHPNPAVAELERSEAAAGVSADAIMERFCAACPEAPQTARCFSEFWRSVRAPERCTLTSASYEAELVRQGKTQTFSGNLGGPCNTQVALSFDAARRVWTYTELALASGRCASTGGQPLVYTSDRRFALPDLLAHCERLSFQ